MTTPAESLVYLIECRTIDGNSLYWCGHEHGGWSPDVNMAIRFPTRKAANLRAMGGLLASGICVVEHLWMTP